VSVEAIGNRIAEIQAKQQALLGSPAPVDPAAFGQAMATATAGTPGAAGPTATAAVGAPADVGTGPVPYAAEIDAAAARHGLDPALLKALIKQESGFDPNARSPAGASGLTQLMPGTAASLGVTDPTDPKQAIEGGAKYLKQQLDRFGGDPEKALAAYNAGPGAVQKFGGIPPYAETQNYVKKVMGYAEAFRAQGVTASASAPVAAAMSSPLGMGAPAGAPAPAAVASSPSQFGIV
jgi:soluble lytic murein transglycosylase-like protein